MWEFDDVRGQAIARLAVELEDKPACKVAIARQYGIPT